MSKIFQEIALALMTIMSGVIALICYFVGHLYFVALMFFVLQCIGVYSLVKQD